MICKDKQTNCVAVQLFLNDMNDKMARIEADSPDGDIAEIVPLAIMTENKEFFDYITIQQRKVFSDPQDFTASRWGIPDKVKQTRDQTQSAGHRFRALTKVRTLLVCFTLFFSAHLPPLFNNNSSFQSSLESVLFFISFSFFLFHPLPSRIVEKMVKVRGIMTEPTQVS